MDRHEMETRMSEILGGFDERVVAAYLFGSVARGTATEASDVDVGILLRECPPRHLSDLPQIVEARLEQALHRDVQVVVLNHAPDDLVHRVLRDGRLLIERDRSFRIQFEVASRNRYFDLLPFVRRYRRYEPVLS